MKASLPLTALATAALSAASTFAPVAAVASTFGQTEINQDKTIAIAAPVGETDRHQLLILEQISSTRPCWKETGANQIDPLLLDFNFSGICGRATDSNGYSIRVGGQDLGMQYSLRVEEQGDDLVLMGVPFGRRNNPALEIARAEEVSDGFIKLELNPGWRFAKRNYQGRTLGHTYLTNDLTLSELAETSPVAERPTRPSRPIARPETPTKPSEPTSEPTVAERLGLTAQQTREVAAIHQTYTARIATGRSELQRAQTRLNQMMAEETSTRNLRRQQKQVRQLQADLSDLYFDGMMDIRGILSSEQRGEFAQLVAELGSFENLSGQLVGSAR
ncbi:MAG: DUF3747 domain-containing protein [Cyanobacteriota bacterium]|nr:DUF3747 domain-containing protein [Cyanobacteriota bacterium]